jgi:hypothetical protein
MCTHPVWRSSKYPFRIDSSNPALPGKVELWIDVTGSAPKDKAPGEVLSGIFTQTIDQFRNRRCLEVLDFGAGKLRNTLYFLEENHKVVAVEFEKWKQTEQGQMALAKAENFNKPKKKKRFRRYIFPDQFVSLNADYDLILLINVINIMPVPVERLLVLLHCYQKLRTDGKVLWYTQYGDQDQRNRCTEMNRIGDGYYLGANKFYNTFYRQFTAPEIDAMMLACGFQLEKTLKAGKNQARIYRKAPVAVLEGVLTESMIESARLVDWRIKPPTSKNPKPVNTGVTRSPDDPSLSREQLLRKRLKTLKTGRETATIYEYLAACIVEFLFRGHLVNLSLQQTTHQGRRRIDFVLTNSSTSGLFRNLVKNFGFRVPYVHFECKNFGGDPKNPEFDQLKGRLGGYKGEVGFLLCRKIQNPEKVLKLQQDALEDSKLILVLTDDDLEILLDYKLDNDDAEGSKHLDNKVKEVVLRY